MTAYIIKKWMDIQWFKKDGRSFKFFITDMDDILLFLRHYNKEYNQILNEESIVWDKEKEEIRFKYYEDWDTNKEYPNDDYFDTEEIKWIREI